jgi:hypothetical protein
MALETVAGTNAYRPVWLGLVCLLLVVVMLVDTFDTLPCEGRAVTRPPNVGPKP